jgi:hypothetical protein
MKHDGYFHIHKEITLFETRSIDEFKIRYIQRFTRIPWNGLEFRNGLQEIVRVGMSVIDASHLDFILPTF